MIEHIRKSECEWMNGEANVIMSDWMCECVRRGGGGVFIPSPIFGI